MLRTALVVTAIIFSVTAAAAQSDPVKTREDLMKQNNQHLKTLGNMAKGEEAFNAAKVNAAFAQWADTAEKIPNLFPDTAKTGGDNRASPKIWENKADFNTRIAAFAKVIADNKDKAKDLDGLKAVFPIVSKSCDDCHKPYRLSAQR